ncbi:MAG: bacillithiol system redox-active protein YtxJ [Bacteroidetes bacterium]|nr:bacillithiol system redox-active protein YtxJ [Bacteroidota bacterium]MBP7400211.1 bacillithiol system redox-active protein YtxJ [Chitinophagales bacterium]MBP8753739.1 bacillithiol system redox-active protein YtxJ [Chitinophagales bacterium]MBP9189233.1 bacillithiol system redox-active protein YtxJ [Chitinophagales bacterium]MBP9547987.1 bacillithiol system redox-active protein YtxJ [Chitinophagales bacterium]
MIDWKNITSTDQYEELIRESFDKPLIIFKHSRSCGISSMALRRFEKDIHPTNEINLTMVNVRADRKVSNYIAEQHQITHESPQLLLIKNGKVVYHASHSHINANEVLNQLSISDN